ncbi:MAG TPA: cobalamin-dependent protein [Pyrinomonadaceae bacterium]|nr:cobalamin-dependent protein [Pyrinomonadaceae bacterium]
MSLKIVTVIIDVLPTVVPLVAGYLQSYACLDPEIKESCEFEAYSCTTTIDFDEICSELIAKNADIYAFSCYCWNSKLVRRVIDSLVRARPNTHIILGGPQVMNHGHNYLHPNRPHLVLCNGEGEKTFRNYVREVLSQNPDYHNVKGLSFYHDGELITTAPEDRIVNLDEIPSPFKTGCFPDDAFYEMCFLETNRGCPFKCTYCYWGAAVGAKVNKMGQDRVKEDMTWIAKRNISVLFLVDANWGMLQRDVELTEHIAACRKDYGFPFEVHFQSAKNSPARVSQISKILADNGLLGAASIAIQSTSDVALDKVGRSNIKKSTYKIHQENLDNYDINSYVELLWPLPGETIESFRDGLSDLCGSRADSLIIYPLLLINNCELNENREKFGLVLSEDESNMVGEDQLIIGTNEVSLEDYEKGWGITFSMVLLHNLRGLYCVANYLHHSRIRRYGDLFADFADFLTAASPSPSTARIAEFLTKVFQPLRYDMVQAYGRLVHFLCHEDRPVVDACLREFVSSQPWWNDETVRALFEADLLNRVYVYAGPVRELESDAFKYLQVLATEETGYVVLVPLAVQTHLKRILGQRMNFVGGVTRIKHAQKQLPLSDMPYGSSWHWTYCSFRMITSRHLAATWEDTQVAAKVA